MKRYSLIILFIMLSVCNSFLNIFSSTVYNTIHGKIFCAEKPLSKTIITDAVQKHCSFKAIVLRFYF